MTGQGVGGSPGYAVAYPAPVSTITFKDTILSGVYVTNSTYGYFRNKRKRSGLYFRCFWKNGFRIL
ncbi:MAG: hypothetical protein Q8N05_17205 [Bacteroidota bacterium]|nr:hypothetical protein [Bacteroidota bacterium]